MLATIFLTGCDPASSMENQEYVAYLENFERWQQMDVVNAFNHLDGVKGTFACQSELEAAQRARWREEAGPLKIDDVPEGGALKTCLDGFQGSSGLQGGKLGFAVLSRWVNHNFLPEIQKRLDAEQAAHQERLDKAGCGGEQCRALTVVDDLAVLRAGLETAVAWQDARDQCEAANFGGLGGWRLPTKDELVAIRESGRVATDQDVATYWSGTREFDEAGKLGSWLLRFDIKALAKKNVTPKLLPFDDDGRVTLARVRCVHDLTGKAPPPTAVDEMEKVIQGAGCPPRDWDDMGYRWWDYVRFKDGYFIGKAIGKTGRDLKGACKELDWCKMRWSEPSKALAKTIAENPWFAAGPDERCVAKLR